MANRLQQDKYCSRSGSQLRPSEERVCLNGTDRIKVDFVAACQRLHRSPSEQDLRMGEADKCREREGSHEIY